MTDMTGHIDFKGRFGKWEIGRSETDLGILGEHLTDHQFQSALQIGNRNALTDNQAFTLRKLMGMSRIVIITAVDLARADDLDRQIIRLLLQYTHLNGCGLRSEQMGRIDIECILHVSGRMSGSLT